MISPGDHERTDGDLVPRNEPDPIEQVRPKWQVPSQLRLPERPAAVPESPAPTPQNELSFGEQDTVIETLKKEHGRPINRIGNWIGTAIVVIGVVFVPLAVFLFWYFPHLVHPEGLGERLVASENPFEEVFYTHTVSEADARRLIQFLQQAGIFAVKDERNVPELQVREDRRRDGKTVQLSRNGKIFIVAFVVKDGAWNDLRIIDFFQDLRQQLSPNVFGGSPVAIHLCSQVPTREGTTSLTVQKVIE
jgi:hypothetical protein